MMKTQLPAVTDLRANEETAYLLQNPHNQKKLLEGIDEVEALIESKAKENKSH